MKKIFTAALLLASMSMAAQETYQNAELATENLNGTAKYVGMGGAMDALGADISAAGSNPAAIGLFRSNSATMSFGLGVQPNGGVNAAGDSKTNVNFDQVGIVFNVPSSSQSCVNFGFGYRKSSNFNQILDLCGRTMPYTDNGQTYYGSQNTLTYEKYNSNLNDLAYSQVDYLYDKSLLVADDGGIACNSASDYGLSRDRKGFIGNYDIMLGGSSRDRIYWGLTATVADVHYKNNTLFTENLTNDGAPCGSVTLDDYREISGTGFNLKAGIIFRPVEASPFRIGLSVETPTWYSLTTHNSTYLYNNTDFGAYSNGGSLFSSESYEYEISTPWKFGVSAATTVSNKLALGAVFNFSDYSSLTTKIKDGDRYDWWTDSYISSSHTDRVMTNHTNRSLKGVATFKVGAEFKPIPEIAIRAGYNYVSPMYKEDAYRDITLESSGTYYSSTTDYTNWKATNRVTFGLGYYIDRFTLDLAYQYATTKGDFDPYLNINGCTPAERLGINNDRHQLICTLGYRF